MVTKCDLEETHGSIIQRKCPKPVISILTAFTQTTWIRFISVGPRY